MDRAEVRQLSLDAWQAPHPDEAEMEKSLKRYRKALHDYILTMIPHRASADDVLQEALIWILERFYHNGRTSAQIAVETGRSAAAVRQALSRVRRTLKRTVEAQMRRGEGFGMGVGWVSRTDSWSAPSHGNFTRPRLRDIEVDF